MNFLNYLRRVNLLVPPGEAFCNLLIEGSGYPTDATSHFYMFYGNSDNGYVYFNPTRTPGNWILVIED
jgi:hypothetical protein